jgi:hypothetical protein
MKYLVFRQQPNREIVKIAETVYLEDAQQVLTNWHSGFINRMDGTTVFEKNLDKSS